MTWRASGRPTLVEGYARRLSAMRIPLQLLVLSALVLPMAAPDDGAPPLPHVAYFDVAPAEQEAGAAAHGVVYGPWQVRA